MENQISVTDYNTPQLTKPCSTEQIKDFIEKIELKTGWEIFKMLEQILSNKMDSFLIDKDTPRSSLYIGNRIETISFRATIEKKEVRLSIPKKNINSLFGKK